MTRRIVALIAWLVITGMNVLWVWAIVGGGFLDAMFASLPVEDQRLLTPGMLAITYGAMTGILVVTMAYATVGWLLAVRPGGGRMGTILLGGSAVFGAVPFGYAFAGTMALRSPLDPVANVLVLLGPALVPLGYALILPIVALTFPNGRLPSSGWRWPTRAAAGALAASTILIVFTPGAIENVVPWNPIGIDFLPAWVWALAGPVGGIGTVLISVLGVAAVASRYRRGAGVERQQLRWFVAAVLLAVVPITVSPLAGRGGPLAFLLAVFGLLLVPVSVWIAVTRYRLYEIDRLISRGLSWAVLSGVLLAIYAGAVLLLQTVLAGVIQGQTVAVAASTLLAAALFQPLRRRVQAGVDHRFNRARYDAERTATDFADRLRDEVDVDHLQAALATTAGGAVHPDGVGVWLRPAPGAPR
jgi:hypothetical protein